MHVNRTVRAALVALAQLAATGCGAGLDQGASSNEGAALARLPLKQAEAAPQYAPFTSEPIAAFGHGAIVRTDGNVIAPNPQFTRDAQQYYIDRLYREATPAVREEFERLRSQLDPSPGAATEFADNAELIDFLIQRVRPFDAAELTSINAFLANAMREQTSPVELAYIVGDAASRQRYHRTCAENGVPIPPTWNPRNPPADPTKTWQSNGRLTPDFLSNGTTATVWYYESTTPRGLCIALPRAFADGTIDLLGVICQGNDTSKACFWDNARDFAPDEEVEIASLDFNSGPDLNAPGKDVCTNCHRGENVFIVHPESALDLDAKLRGPVLNLNTSLLRAKDWVRPLVDASWPQNPGPGRELDDVDVPATEASCYDCHRTAESKGGRLGPLDNSFYCSIMWKALLSDQATMPPKSHLERLGLSAPETHLAVIGRACGWQ
ncbi:MAG TPA: hypothetical protein VFN67_17635 [Polyangiales bacterium]|jgi:hypothetical protein|nr:hypothetical protein [Polyangiales bacterium]